MFGDKTSQSCPMMQSKAVPFKCLSNELLIIDIEIVLIHEAENIFLETFLTSLVSKISRLINSCQKTGS